MIQPAVGADRDVVAAEVIAAIDQHIADAGCAQFAEGDFLRTASRHRAITTSRRQAAPRRRTKLYRFSRVFISATGQATGR
jgi:hypothetical protein